MKLGTWSVASLLTRDVTCHTTFTLRGWGHEVMHDKKKLQDSSSRTDHILLALRPPPSTKECLNNENLIKISNESVHNNARPSCFQTIHTRTKQSLVKNPRDKHRFGYTAWMCGMCVARSILGPSKHTKALLSVPRRVATQTSTRCSKPFSSGRKNSTIILYSTRPFWGEFSFY